jgi:hypothetical protein
MTVVINTLTLLRCLTLLPTVYAAYNGADWPTTFPGCQGTKQSPLLLPDIGAGEPLSVWLQSVSQASWLEHWLEQ